MNRAIEDFSNPSLYCLPARFQVRENVRCFQMITKVIHAGLFLILTACFVNLFMYLELTPGLDPLLNLIFESAINLWVAKKAKVFFFCCLNCKKTSILKQKVQKYRPTPPIPTLSAAPRGTREMSAAAFYLQFSSLNRFKFHFWRKGHWYLLGIT